MYKGQFLESSFNGFGHFETRYLNDDGQLIISSMIGNWNDSVAKEELLTLFAYLGTGHEVTDSGRAKLSNILFK